MVSKVIPGLTFCDEEAAGEVGLRFYCIIGGMEGGNSAIWKGVSGMVTKHLLFSCLWVR